MTPSLNIDLGELPGEPQELYALAHIANVACGGHAGDDASIRDALSKCRANGACVSAHPSYPDREGFGRVARAMAPADLRETVREQCARLAAAAQKASLRVTHLKAHGALYHCAAQDPATAGALLEGAVAALGIGLTVLGPTYGLLPEAARAAGLSYAREGFADRATLPDGTLVPRGTPGAVLADPSLAAERARNLARSGEVDTVCVHGDTPGALAIARAVRRALDALAASSL